MTINTSKSSTNYALAEGLLNGQTFEITGDQYATLSEALAKVVSALEIEELFQVFAQSFLRFEKELLNVAFEYNYTEMRDLNDDVFFGSIRHRFNVSIITILTSYKCYDDQCDRILKSSVISPETKQFNSLTRSKVFDAHLSYRICAQLRDYAQHRDLPLGGFSIGGKTNLGRNDEGKAIKLDTGFGVSPWLNVTRFSASSQCKAPLRTELSSFGYDKIDMKWLIRSFAGAMYERHAALRAFLKPEIITSGEKISEGYEFVRSKKDGEPRFLELHANDEKQPMRNDLSTKVLKAFETNSSLKRAICSYVTSQITPEHAVYSGQVDA